MSARTRLFAGPVHGPTHRSAPTESIETSINPGRACGDRAPPLPVDCGAKQRADVPKAWLPPTKFRAEIWGVGQVVGPYGKPPQPPQPAGAQRSACASGRKGGAGIGARTIPKGGPPLRSPWQRLAKRKARKAPLVKFVLCPIPELSSTGHTARRSARHPARAHVGAVGFGGRTV